MNSASDEPKYHPHNPKSVSSRDSERWQLLKKINKIVKLAGQPTESTQSKSTGLNRRNRWTTGKVAAGSSIHATSDHSTAGNVVNAQAVARKSAQMVSNLVLFVCSRNNKPAPRMQIVKRRAGAFSSLKNTESLASAKISLLVSLTNGSFGLAIVNDQLMMVEGLFSYCTYILQLKASSVLTMYEKSAARGAKHSWTSSTTSIGAISYLAVRCYQHTRQWQFRALECVVTWTTQFTLLPSLAFLCIVPLRMVRRTTSSHFLELLPGSFKPILQDLVTDKEAVVLAVKGLLRPSHGGRKRVLEGNTVNDDESD